MVSTNILSSTTVFSNDNNNRKCYSILNCFLKDHVTLKSGVMMLKIQLCDHRNKLHFIIYLNYNTISQY